MLSASRRLVATSHSAAFTQLLKPVHERVRGWIIDTVATRDKFGIHYDEPVGDLGLFGPDSVTWKIHADFPGMMAGGIAALMLQTLHPRALAGVWDHSRFRQDPIGRLRNTTTFVAATSYAPTADAERLIGIVDRMHQKVVGTTLEGEPYDAREPELLTWVHCTEMAMFLEGYKRYRRPDLARDVEDRYFDETRCIAERLGARDVPASRAEMDDYFAAIQPELRFDERSRATLAVLEAMDLPVPMAGLSRRTFLGAGAALLPEWARSHMQRSRRQRLIDRASATALHRVAPLIRASMSEGVALRSARRCGAGPEALVFE
ncbi:oxygenase MpaB family protein [Salinisphaera sp. SPP-AMP-43]|uniref:oxygenase MpaB family protein n=1 Tax=Salinisphaera sp. SPP-AMP-43 TaxID=3121288 RepID=UPI003C6E31D0